MELRGCDDFGCGFFDAPRGDRRHEGVDIKTKLGTPIFSFSSGVVEKIGYPYVGDWFYRLVDIRDELGVLWRYFYVEPEVKVGDKIEAHDRIGVAQDVSVKYNTRTKKMTPHIHFQMEAADGSIINPTPIVQD